MSSSQETFTKVFQHNLNSVCADCFNDPVEYANVNYGSLVCADCATAHRALGNGISFVKPLNDKWGARELKAIEVGGNLLLKKFFESYKLPHIASIEYKYSTIAAKYYRKMIRSKSQGEPYNEDIPALEEGLSLITNPSEYNIPEGIAGKIVDSTLDIGKSIYSKVKENDAYKKLEGATLELGKNLYGKVKDIESYKYVEGIKIGAQKAKDQFDKSIEIGKEGLDWTATQGILHLEKGADLGSKGVDYLKQGTLNAYNHAATTANHTLYKFQLGKKNKNAKEDHTLNPAQSTKSAKIHQIDISDGKKEYEDISTPPDYW